MATHMGRQATVWRSVDSISVEQFPVDNDHNPEGSKMKTMILRTMMLLLASMLLLSAGCAKRGLFGSEACPSSERVDVPGGSDVVLAVYYDKNGQPLGTAAENMHGTKDNKMCPAPEPGGGSGCASGSCPISVGAKTYCVKPCP
jgi:hypothetical protein